MIVKCEVCGRDYEYGPEQGGPGYANDVCSSFCDGRKSEAKKTAKLLEALGRMVHWFGKYPEWIPNPEHNEAVAADIAKAAAALHNT